LKIYTRPRGKSSKFIPNLCWRIRRKIYVPIFFSDKTSIGWFQGAQISDTVYNLFVKNKIIKGKPIKKSVKPKKKEDKEKKEAKEVSSSSSQAEKGEEKEEKKEAGQEDKKEKQDK